MKTLSNNNFLLNPTKILAIRGSQSTSHSYTINLPVHVITEAERDRQYPTSSAELKQSQGKMEDLRGHDINSPPKVIKRNISEQIRNSEWHKIISVNGTL